MTEEAKRLHPWTVPAIPISLRGMAVEAATVTGLVFLFP